MSVVAEDPTMVKYLLNQGIAIEERCYGNFFCPDDQKRSRGDSLDFEIVTVQTQTNYQGFVYWGEYPLCFAAVLDQVECFRLILARGKLVINPQAVGQTAYEEVCFFVKLIDFTNYFKIYIIKVPIRI